jgi:Ni/Fe-hydrogenase subunit HybB-like protein
MFSTLLELACGRELPREKQGMASRWRLAISAVFFALLLSAIWGAAAGSKMPTIAVANTYKLPIILLAALAAALPGALLAWKLGATPGKASRLVLPACVGVFAASLVLAVAAPILALYYHSSEWAGPLLAQGSVVAAIAVGLLTFVRALFVLDEEDTDRRTFILPICVLSGTHLAALLQLIALWSPLLPERTHFDRGIDQLADKVPAQIHQATEQLHGGGDHGEPAR